MDTYSLTQYNNDQTPRAPHAIIGKCSLAGWEGFWTIDVRAADGTQIGYYRAPGRGGVESVLTDYGVEYIVEGE